MALASGTTLGPYEILAMLGAGGMGEVYRARDTRLDRTVAVKVLASHLSSSPELKQRMEREAKAISSLNHPHICHLYDIGSQDGTDYMVMEFLEGETLAERLRKGAMPLNEIFKTGIAVAESVNSTDHRGQHHWHHPIHVAGADRGKGSGRPLRHFCIRCCALRDGDRKTRVPGQVALEHGVVDPGKGSRSHFDRSTSGPEGSGARGPDLPRKGPGRALPKRARSQAPTAVAYGRRRRGSCGGDTDRCALSHEGVGGMGGRRARCGRERAVLDHARHWQQACGRPFFDRPAGEHLA